MWPVLAKTVVFIRHACHNAGLEVVATMCDMGSKIVKDWKHMGVSEMIPFFRFQRQEVAAVCDLSHVLKYTHNLVLKHGVSNVEREITVNGEQLLVLLIVRTYWRCMKLTYILCNICSWKWSERHMRPCAQSAVEVSLSVQVVNSIVPTAINSLVTVGMDNYTDM